MHVNDPETSLEYIFSSGFLESINNMLTSGMVPALFLDDEKESVVGQVCIIMVSICA